MANGQIDVSRELAAIMSAVYGEQVRKSIHDAIAEIADECEAWMEGEIFLIPENSDLNSYTTLGRYYSNSTATTETITNKPAGIAGGFHLLVSKGRPGQAGTQIRQFLMMNTVNSNDIYARYKEVSTWSEWKRIAYDDGQFLNITKCIAMNTDDDLNNYTTPGTYYSANDEMTTSFYNAPPDANGSIYLFVSRGRSGNDGTQIRQIIIENGASSNNIFSRYKEVSTWGEWKRIAYDDGQFLNLTKEEILNSGDDLNYFITPGTYYSPSSEITELILNKPEGIAGGFHLLVYRGRPGEADTQIRQFVMMNTVTSNEIYVRYKEVITWSPWRRIVYDMGQYLNIKNQTLIAQGDDLNDYTTSGIFYSNSSATTNSIVNKPEQILGGFQLMVFNGRGGNLTEGTQIRQILMINTANSNDIYTRYKEVTSWSDWKQVSYEDYSDIPKIINPTKTTDTDFLTPMQAFQTSAVKKTINVCSFNVARYNNSSGSVYVYHKPKMLMNYRSFLLNEKIDILFVQEHTKYVDGGDGSDSSPTTVVAGTRPVYEWLYKGFFNDFTYAQENSSDPSSPDYNQNSQTNKDNAHKAIYSKFTISPVNVRVVTDKPNTGYPASGKTAYFLWSVVSIPNVGNVLLIDIHNYANSSANSYYWHPFEQRGHYLDVISEFITQKKSECDYCIIAGDFNSSNQDGKLDGQYKYPNDDPNNVEDYKLIKRFCSNNALIQANGGAIGWFKTNEPNNKDFAYDNILVSNNIAFNSVKCNPDLLTKIYTDHSPIVSSISFLDTTWE